MASFCLSTEHFHLSREAHFTWKSSLFSWSFYLMFFRMEAIGPWEPLWNSKDDGQVSEALTLGAKFKEMHKIQQR